MAYDADPLIQQNMAGVFCKNLFLKDRKGVYYLVITPQEMTVDFKKLRKELCAYRNFSFASASELEEKLHVHPGGVSPFGLIFDQPPSVNVAIEESLCRKESLLNFHPLDISKTSLITFSDLSRFIEYTCHVLKII